MLISKNINNKKLNNGIEEYPNPMYFLLIGNSKSLLRDCIDRSLGIKNVEQNLSKNIDDDSAESDLNTQE